MPLFEYFCGSCDRRFETFVVASRGVACPDCGSAEVRKLLSVFAVGGDRPQGVRAAADTAPAGCGSCGDPRGPGACAAD